MNQIDIIIDDIEQNPDEWGYWQDDFVRSMNPDTIRISRSTNKCKLRLNTDHTERNHHLQMPVTLTWWENIKLLSALNMLERHKLLRMTNSLQDSDRNLPIDKWIEKRNAGEI